ncbi:hypothetical protein [Sabulibacter ruber]|uniref:hypothetical protein n=1 Tax=Sabulibacter ruber TaxID=2811901 RepID=UPI001A96EEA8|nr:hypothetical protein [Sabulibacter ruber]
MKTKFANLKILHQLLERLRDDESIASSRVQDLISIAQDEVIELEAASGPHFYRTDQALLEARLFAMSSRIIDALYAAHSAVNIYLCERDAL